METKRIGRYDIKKLIGQGGMSAVFLGYDPRSHREVAIKVLPPYYLHAIKFRERFEREALTIALLEHPAIVPVYDMGEEGGQPYIVMRYMSGGSLAERLKQGPLQLKDALEMISRLAPALDAAHQKGIVHRDVKPDNILFDQYENVFLSDFGLARLKESLGFANISDGNVMGTPAYMSPEQIQGNQELDGRSDIYSLGVVLYHMLSGMVPYTGSTAASVMMMHLINPVPHVYEKNEALPTAVQIVLEKAMAKDPKDRYQTAIDLANALQEAITGYLGALERKPVPVVAEQPETDTMIFPPEELDEAAGAFPISKPVPPLTLARRLVVPRWAWLAGGAAAILLIGIFLLSGGWQKLFGASPTPSQTSVGSVVISPTHTSPPESPPVVLGGADKLAFLNAGEIWISNLDGSGLEQLTEDGLIKSNLQWSPDGRFVLFTSAECLYTASLETGQVEAVFCMSVVLSLSTFEISPGGDQAAIGLANGELYLADYDLRRLADIQNTSDLAALVDCQIFAPYQVQGLLKAVRWSADDRLLAIQLGQEVQDTYRDSLLVLDARTCQDTPIIVDEIGPTDFLFSIRGYYDYPEFSSFAWDGNEQFLVNSGQDEAGFGELQLYNLLTGESQAINPVEEACCYRDVRFSPDGSYLFFAYQPRPGGAFQWYYLPFAEAQAGVSDTLLPIVDDLLPDQQYSSQPVLRAVP